MGIQLVRSDKPGRNDFCPCGSKLKFKKCHGDPLKIAVCNRVANEKMVGLIRAEQFKKIIRMQQEACEVCDGKGYVIDPNGLERKPCECQFVRG